MADENSDEASTVPSMRSLQRYGNLRKNIRKKSSAPSTSSSEGNSADLMNERQDSVFTEYNSQTSQLLPDICDMDEVDSYCHSDGSSCGSVPEDAASGSTENTNSQSCANHKTASEDLTSNNELKSESAKKCEQNPSTNKNSKPHSANQDSNFSTQQKSGLVIGTSDDTSPLIGQTVNSLSMDLSRGVGILSKAASSAWDYFSATLEHLTPGGDDSGSDISWHDAGSDVTDDEEIDFFDASEDHKPRDRIHYICSELLSTEESYVQRLQVLVKVKRKTSKLLGPDTARQMFHDIETITTFHSDYLLPTLKDRLKKWGQYERIGDVMKKLAPFLKLYTEYVKNMQRSTSLVNHHEEKSSGFASVLRKVKEKQPRTCGNQAVQAHMMEPVQRVPRYELLLRDYLKHLPEGATDRADAEEALLSMSGAAKHFEEMIKRDSRMLELLEIQHRLEGANIVSPNRELVKQGRLNKVTGKNTLTDRYVYLFNDMLLVCSKAKIAVITKFKVKQEFNFKDTWVIEGTNLEQPNTFCLGSQETQVELMASSKNEHEEWLKTLRETRHKCVGEEHETEELPKEDEAVTVLHSGEVWLSCDEGKTWKRKNISVTRTGWLNLHGSTVDSEVVTCIDLRHFTKTLVDHPLVRRSHTLALPSSASAAGDTLGRAVHLAATGGRRSPVPPEGSDTQPTRSDQTIVLTALGRKYFLYHDDQEQLNSWISHMDSFTSKATHRNQSSRKGLESNHEQT